PKRPFMLFCQAAALVRSCTAPGLRGMKSAKKKLVKQLSDIYHLVDLLSCCRIGIQAGAWRPIANHELLLLVRAMNVFLSYCMPAPCEAASRRQSAGLPLAKPDVERYRGRGAVVLQPVQ